MKRTSVNVKALLFFLISTFAFAGIGALFGGNMDISQWKQPPLSPPAWLFPIVWTILYALMSIAAYLVYVSKDIDRPCAIRLYYVQLIVNALWPLFFFRLNWLFFSFLWLLLLLALVILTAVAFRPISRTAFRLLVPYLLWLCFAGYLNFGIYLLNR